MDVDGWLYVFLGHVEEDECISHTTLLNNTNNIN